MSILESSSRSRWRHLWRRLCDVTHSWSCWSPTHQGRPLEQGTLELRWTYRRGPFHLYLWSGQCFLNTNRFHSYFNQFKTITLNSRIWSVSAEGHNTLFLRFNIFSYRADNNNIKNSYFIKIPSLYFMLEEEMIGWTEARQNAIYWQKFVYRSNPENGCVRVGSPE